PDPACDRRQPRVCPRARLSGAAHPPPRGVVRRRLRRTGRRLSAARLYAVLHPWNDGRPRLDCARSRGVRLMAAGPRRHRRLSVRLRHHSAAPFPGASRADPVPVHVVLAVSRHRGGVDRHFAPPRLRRVGSTRIIGARLRARPLNDLRGGGRAPRPEKPRTPVINMRSRTCDLLLLPPPPARLLRLPPLRSFPARPGQRRPPTSSRWALSFSAR